jgi:hypothetical protein
MYHQEDCTATGCLSHKDRCSESLHEEGLLSVESSLLYSVEKTAFDSQSCRWPAFGKHRLRRLDRLDELQPGRIALKAAQQSSQTLSSDFKNDMILPAGEESLPTYCGVTDILAIWPRVHLSDGRNCRQPHTESQCCWRCTISEVGTLCGSATSSD